MSPMSMSLMQGFLKSILNDVTGKESDFLVYLRVYLLPSGFSNKGI